MITRKLRFLTLLASLLLVAHAIEEWKTGMFLEDPLFQSARRFPGGAPEASFVFFEATLFLCLLLMLAMIHSERWRLRVLIGFGVVLVAEVQHVLLALYNLHYEPGLITGISIAILAIFYWRELLVARRASTTTH